MSANAGSQGSSKRAARPKQLEKLDVALEREKSVKARQKQTAVATSAKNGRPSNVNEAVTTREKSPTKQRNAANKVAVAASDSQPAKRPASAPVHPVAKSDLKPTRASASSTPGNPSSLASKQQQPSSAADSAGVKALDVPPRRTAFESSGDRAESGADDDNDGDGDGGGDGSDADDKDIPARGHYDIFIQTRKCEDLCRDLGLTLKHIRRMKKKYDDNDMYCTGEITQAEFFYMINEEERPISKGIFKFGGIAPDQKYISFDEYALCIVSFASLTKPELFQYVFDLYDDDRSGSLDEREFTKMSKELQSKQFCFPKNVETAIKMLGGTDGGRGVGTEDGLVDIAQFMKFARNFPVAFYPIVNMQKNIRAATLGESFWSRIVARKLKTQELLSHMRRNYGAIPEMTTRERISSIFSDDVFHIRKRAGELYATELKQRRHIGSSD